MNTQPSSFHGLHATFSSLLNSTLLGDARLAQFCTGRELFNNVYGDNIDLITYTEAYFYRRQSQTPEDIEIFLNAKEHNKSSTISQ